MSDKLEELYSKSPARADAYAKLIKDLHSKFMPHQGQIDIGRSILTDNCKDVFVCAGRNFGKTQLAIYLLWRYALTFPNSQCYYFAPYAKQAREILWANNRLAGFMPKNYRDGQPSSITMRINLINGSFIKVDGSDNVEAYRGVKPNGLVIFDEFKDFREEFYVAFDPNRAAHDAPLLLIGTPPDRDCQFTSLMEEYKKAADKKFFRAPSSANPHISREWLAKKKAELVARGEADVWEREYEANYIKGGANKIFPMLDEAKHKRPHEWMVSQIRRDRKKLHWFNGADPAASSVFAGLFIGINPFNRIIYVMDEVYETEQAAMSVKQICPRFKRMREELYDDDFRWRLIYDEAESWFRNEALEAFGEAWEPSQKAMNDKANGISLIKDILNAEKIFISERCKKFWWELDNYYKDKNGNIPKKWDHCIAGEELVDTSEGKKPIKNIIAGDLVLTRKGFRRVTASAYMGKREIVKIQCSNGSVLKCTPDHKIYTKNKGWIEADALRYGDIIVSSDECLKSFSTASSTDVKENQETVNIPTTLGVQHNTLGMVLNDIFIGQCGFIIMVKYQKIITYITKTAIHLITPLKILSAFTLRFITKSTLKKDRIGAGQKRRLKILRGLGHWQQNGTREKKAINGIRLTVKRSLAKKIELNVKLFANNVAKNIRRIVLASNQVQAGFAEITVGQRGEESRAWITNRDHASSVEKSLPLTNTSKKHTVQEPAHKVVGVARLGNSEDTYDLSVEDVPEFFASGILVHNCIDTVRYILAADAYTLTTEEEKLIEPEDMPRPEKLPLDWEEWSGLQEDQDWALF